MTAYHGGKARIGEILAKVMYQECIKRDFCPIGYCEPFCGMLGVYQHIVQLFANMEKICGYKMKYLASDINTSLILMWKSVQKGWKPPTKMVTEEEFFMLKYNGQSSAIKGYVGHFYGYMGRYFVPFRHARTQKESLNQSQKIIRIAEKLKQVRFTHGSYKKTSHLKNFIIYLDGPYEEFAAYYDEGGKRRTKFDQLEFWDWCRKMTKHNLLFISAYSAPSDFIEIFSIQSRTTKSPRTERLFMFESNKSHLNTS